MSSNYILNYPRNIVFGTGTLNSLSSHVPAKFRLLIACGQHSIKNGLAEKLRKLLSDSETAVCVLNGHEAPLEDVDRLIDTARKFAAQGIIAIGGGSVLDSAKTAAALAPLEGTVRDYFTGKKSIPGKGLFFAALPTTAGTGTEITANAVLQDKESRQKKSIRHITMIPDLALVDPELTKDAPAELTANSGLDAFVQAVESYLSIKANTVSRAIALESARLVAENLRGAVEHPGNMQFRSGMAEGSMLSAMAFSQSGLGAVHGMAHPIGAMLGIPHGLCCAILLLPVLEFNMKGAEEDYARLAVTCGAGKTAGDFISFVKNFCKELKVPSHLRDWKFEKAHYEFIAKNSRSNSMSCNRREFTDANIAELLDKLV